METVSAAVANMADAYHDIIEAVTPIATFAAVVA